MVDEVVRRGGASMTRSFVAPTQAEAEALARPTIEAYTAAGWRLEDRLWVPGDRRPSLVESLVLSPESENLLDADGTLRLTFGNDAADAPVPELPPTSRLPDEFESLAGTRYRRLAPRWIISGVVFLIGLLIVFSMLGGAPGFGDPQPDANGVCPLGYAPSYSIYNGTTTAISCTRI